jgi:protein ImuB
MAKRFVSIWFHHLPTDWFTLRQPELKNLPLVLTESNHGKLIITATNQNAEQKGISSGTPLADARAVIPDLVAMEHKPLLIIKVLTRLAEWCIRFTPTVAIDPPNGLILDATGCSHLWGGDTIYIETISEKLNARGYGVRIAMADTMGAAWAIARFSKDARVIPEGKHPEALRSLPTQSLRLEPEVSERLYKLGLHNIQHVLNLPRPSLRKRFGQHLLQQLDKALGNEMEWIEPLQPIEPYQERLPSLEPIVTEAGIKIALHQLITLLCTRLQQEQKGLRMATFKGYRVDGKVEQIEIGTSRPSNNVTHLSKLFELKLSKIEPAWGIELFVMAAWKVEDHHPQQETMWTPPTGVDDQRITELVDRIAGKLGMNTIHRYAPAEHHWPERSFTGTTSLNEKLISAWPEHKLRPLQLLPTPQRIEVTAPIPDYPPMLFRHQGKIHTIVKADGPERIEQEWWLQQGQHRDYYQVEDETGNRYWLFRLGHYQDKTVHWFLHGFFP